MESPHLLFNIHSPEEWNNELVPTLNMILSYDGGTLAIMGTGTDYDIVGFNPREKTIKYKINSEVMDTIYEDEFEDFYLIDEEKRILTEKTIFLIDLHNHIFIN